MPAASSGAACDGPAAGDEGDAAGATSWTTSSCSARELRRHEAEHADAPRPVAEQLGGLDEQVADLGAGQQGEGQERQAAAVGDGGGERGPVADAGHRALGDRVAGAVGGRRRRRRAPAAVRRRRPRRWSSMAARTAWTTPPTVTKRRARPAAKPPSWPIGQQVAAQVGPEPRRRPRPAAVSSASAAAGRSGRV